MPTKAMSEPQIEQLKRWEAGLTEEQIVRAFEFVRRHGWDAGSNPPPYVWQMAYLHVDPDMAALGLPTDPSGE